MPHIGQMTEALRHAAQGNAANRGGIVFQKKDYLGAVTHLGNRGSSTAAEPRPCCDQRSRERIATSCKFDEIGIPQDGRAGNHRAGDLRLVFGEGHDDRTRSNVRGRKSFCQRQPHLRRRIVQQIGHCHYRGAMLVRAKSTLR